MSIAEEVLRRVQALAPDQQMQVLRFVERLHAGEPVRAPRSSLRGLWKGMGFDVTAEDIAEARREMWGSFPRDIDQW